MASKGQEELVQILIDIGIHPDYITYEHYIEGLRLDIYIPKYKIAIEYHGRQHFEYVDHFHKTKEAFEASKQRDRLKVDLCAAEGITLLVFNYDDNTTKDVVYDKITDALDRPLESPKIDRELSFKERVKKQNKERRKEQYDRFKARRKRQRRDE